MKLAIGLPAYRSTLHAQQAHMWIQLGEEAVKRDVEIVYTQYIDCCGVEIARNKLMHSALDDRNSPDWLFMIDSDNAVLPVDGKTSGQLILDMIALVQDDKTVAAIGAPCFKRGNPKEHGMINARNKVNGEFRLLAASEVAGRPSAVHRLGTGVMAFQVDWIRKHWPKGPWFQIVFPEEFEGRRWIGEDDWFCDEVWKRDGKIICDARFFAAHSNVGRTDAE